MPERTERAGDARSGDARSGDAGRPVVRRARTGDAAPIAAIHVLTWQAAYRGLLPDSLLDGLSVERRQAGWTRHLAEPGPSDATWVAERDGVIVGFADVGAARDDDAAGAAAELYAIYVHPEHWHEGAGRALLTAVVDHWRAHDVRRAVLWVLEDNERSRRFYEQSGWTVDGARRPYPDDGPTNIVRYAIELSGAARAGPSRARRAATRSSRDS